MNTPSDWSRDRKEKTWREGHPLTEEQRNRLNRRRKGQQNNRQLRNFGKVNWEHYSHPRLYDMIMTADAEAMRIRSDQWRELARKIGATTDEVQTIIRQAMGTWRGSAAVAAAASNTRLTQWAGDASHTATQIAAGMADYTEAVSVAQRRMPPPAFATAERNARDGWAIDVSGRPSDAILIDRLITDHLVSHEKARAEKAEAVQVMEDYEQESRRVHDGLPRFDNDAPGPPPPPEEPPPGGTPPGGAFGSPGIGGSPGSADDTTTTSFASPSPSGPNAGPNPGTGPGLPGQPGSSAADPTRGGGPGGFGGVGGVAGGPGARGGAGAAGGPLAARGGGPGAAGSLAGARGGAGAAGGFFPPVAGAGTRGEEDGEHKNKYDEGLDLFDDLPPAYPPVFGA